MIKAFMMGFLGVLTVFGWVAGFMTGVLLLVLLLHAWNEVLEFFTPDKNNEKDVKGRRRFLEDL